MGWPRTTTGCAPASRWGTSIYTANGWPCWGRSVPGSRENSGFRMKSATIKNQIKQHRISPKRLSYLCGPQIDRLCRGSLGLPTYSFFVNNDH